MRSSSRNWNSPPNRQATSSPVQIIFRIFFGEKEKASAAAFIVNRYASVLPREDPGTGIRQETEAANRPDLIWIIQFREKPKKILDTMIIAMENKKKV